jgi:predicted metal-dependent phosphoesterase TrpH
MQIKAALHLHIDLDNVEHIGYSGFQAIDKAYQEGFKVLAFTCHDTYIDVSPFQEYANKYGILVIPGIEKTINHQHVIILNCQKDALEIENFEQLSNYKSSNPDCFILAPHPYYKTRECLGKNLLKWIYLFDGIEFSYCYHKLINPNIKAIKVAAENNKTLIGTSDIHFLDYFTNTYTVVNLNKELTVQNFIQSLKKNQVEIITKSFSLLGLIKLIYKMLTIKKKNVLQKQKPISRKSLSKS